MAHVDVAVIGAGVTGLAAAEAVARRGASVCVLERHPRPGLDTSTHNSGVIHAGLYYPAGSLKAALCVEGRHRLYTFCAAHGVPHRRCGKLVVAASEAEIPALEALHRRAQGNGVEGLEMLDAADVRRFEPAIHAVAAMRSTQTGVVDADALVRALLARAQDAGTMFLPGTPLVGAEPSPGGGVRLRTPRELIDAAQVVNAAGLYADEVSAQLGGEIFAIHPCRGEYAALSAAQASRVGGLVYPLPHGHGLGVHLVRTLHGEVWLGPTVRFQDRKDDYERDRLPIEAFLEPAQRLLPTLTLADLRLAGSGIRAKLHGPDEAFADFLIRRDAQNPFVVHAAGIESPGLTSCLAIGEHVARVVMEIS